MKKLQYKPIAVQDECFGSRDKNNPELTVLIKLEAQAKNGKRYKTDALSFPDANYLDKYITENNLIILPEEEFNKVEQVLLISKATRAK